MFVKDLRKGISCSIGTSSYSKWISIEKSEKHVGLKIQ
jgi:hypothetical protein